MLTSTKQAMTNHTAENEKMHGTQYFHTLFCLKGQGSTENNKWRKLLSFYKNIHLVICIKALVHLIWSWVTLRTTMAICCLVIKIH